MWVGLASPTALYTVLELAADWHDTAVHYWTVGARSRMQTYHRLSWTRRRCADLCSSAVVTKRRGLSITVGNEFESGRLQSMTVV